MPDTDRRALDVGLQRGVILQRYKSGGLADCKVFRLADGLSWRRAVDPSFNAEAVMPLVLGMVEHLLTKSASANDNKTGD